MFLNELISLDLSREDFIGFIDVSPVRGVQESQRNVEEPCFQDEIVLRLDELHRLLATSLPILLRSS